ncbi:hypothetical protein [Georgenia sp. Z1491]|uniref:hypothetical protein n=1 Tax=Georgenia sp. Z1491 TaxID=3416707 RepID=UPI003CF54F0F
MSAPAHRRPPLDRADDPRAADTRPTDTGPERTRPTSTGPDGSQPAAGPIDTSPARPAAGAALIALLLALTACGGSDDEGTTEHEVHVEVDDAADGTPELAPVESGSDDAVEVDADQTGAETLSDGAAGGGYGVVGEEVGEEAQEAGPTIRDVDLSTLPWRQALTGESVVPVEGDEYGRIYTVGEQIEFADVDGDGHEDALAVLEVVDGNAVEETWYIWTWDPEAEAAVQVESPVARTARCGDTVHEVAAVDGAFAVTEALRYQDDTSGDCATDGPIVHTRHVTLESGWPVLTGGLSGEGGICPQFQYATDDMWPVGDVELHAAPVDGSAPLGEPRPDWWLEVDVSRHEFLWRPNWILVHQVYDAQPEALASSNGYRPCAWAYLADDQRPLPHGPYVDDL